MTYYDSYDDNENKHGWILVVFIVAVFLTVAFFTKCGYML